MTLSIYPITDGFAAEIYDVDLSQPLSREDSEAIKQAFWSYSVLIFPEQRLDQVQHVAFASRFGPIDHSVLKTAISDKKLRVPEEIADVSNLDQDNRIWGRDSRLRMLQLGNQIWHTDSSFKFVPALCSLLYALEIPPVGGHTEFADLRAAYDALPESTQVRISGLIAQHSLLYSRQRIGYTEWEPAERTAMAPVPQVMVRTVPQTGRKNLYVAAHAGHIIGMDDAQARPLIDELLAHATQRQFTYTHRWRQHDLVMWDNRCTLHRGLPFDDLRFRRDMQRATALDVANTCEQEGVAVPEIATA